MISVFFDNVVEEARSFQKEQSTFKLALLLFGDNILTKTTLQSLIQEAKNLKYPENSYEENKRKSLLTSLNHLNESRPEFDQ